MRKIFNFSLIFLFLVFFQACGFEIVDTGYRGVETRFGEVVSDSLKEGWHWYNPLTSDITELDVRSQNLEYKIACYTKDLQPAQITIGVIANVERSSAHLLYKDYGKDWEDRIMPQNIEGSVKTVVGLWDAVDLISNREKARSEMQNRLSESLGDKYIQVVKLDIMNIDYSDNFETAIEKKVVAVQAAIEAQNKTIQIKEEAQQKVISAKAEAESMRIRANALTQNKALVDYEAVQKWNGVLPTYVMGNSIPFVNIK
jgi:prohibitin 2